VGSYRSRLVAELRYHAKLTGKVSAVRAKSRVSAHETFFYVSRELQV
jgi:hypothetical protein